MRHYGLDEQINHLRESGITFGIMSEDDARTFLRENTYYYKLGLTDITTGAAMTESSPATSHISSNYREWTSH